MSCVIYTLNIHIIHNVSFTCQVVRFTQRRQCSGMKIHAVITAGVSLLRWESQQNIDWDLKLTAPLVIHSDLGKKSRPLDAVISNIQVTGCVFICRCRRRTCEYKVSTRRMVSTQVRLSTCRMWLKYKKVFYCVLLRCSEVKRLTFLYIICMRSYWNDNWNNIEEQTQVEVAGTSRWLTLSPRWSEESLSVRVPRLKDEIEMKLK